MCVGVSCIAYRVSEVVRRLQRGSPSNASSLSARLCRAERVQTVVLELCVSHPAAAVKSSCRRPSDGLFRGVEGDGRRWYAVCVRMHFAATQLVGFAAVEPTSSARWLVVGGVALEWRCGACGDSRRRYCTSIEVKPRHSRHTIHMYIE